MHDGGSCLHDSRRRAVRGGERRFANPDSSARPLRNMITTRSNSACSRRRLVASSAGAAEAAR